MSAFARVAVAAILRQHGRSKADALAILDELGAGDDEMAALDAFLSGRTDDIDIVPIEDMGACARPDGSTLA
jgi:hypothetical protein